MPTRSTPSTSTFCATTVDECRDYVHSRGLHLRLRAGAQPRYSETRHVIGGATIVTISIADLAISLARGDALVIVTCLSGSLTRTTSGVVSRLGPGDAVIISQPGVITPQELAADRAELVVAALDVDLVADVAAAAPDFDGTPPAFTAARPATPAAERLWRRTLTHVTHDVLEEPAAAASAFVGGEASRLLAAIALQTFPNSAIPLGQRDSEPATPTGALDLAIAFIEGHAEVDISVADIARAASVTNRALQLAFRRHLDTTPMRYLRWVRLARAHEMLSMSVPGDGVTVTDIANRWGFFNSGRFTAYYREAYGVPPSRTLRQHPSAVGAAPEAAEPTPA